MKETSQKPESRKLAKKTVVRRFLLGAVIILGVYVLAALLPPLLKDDGISKYSGVQERVARAALDSAYRTDMIPFFFHFIKASVSEVYPVCSERDKNTIAEECSRFIFNPDSTSSYNVRVKYYTFFGKEQKTVIFRGDYLGI